MGTGTIAIIVKNGFVNAQTKFRELDQNDIANLITHLEMLKQEYLMLYAKGVKKDVKEKRDDD